MKKTLQKLNRLFDRFPLRFGALLFLILFILISIYLYGSYSIGEPSSKAVFDAITKYLLIFLFAVVAFAFLSLLIAYIVFIIREKRDTNYLTITLNFDDNNKKRVKSIAQIKAKRMLFPLFGAIKVRFVFENKLSTPKYNLSSKKFRLLSTKNFEAFCTLDLSNVQNYVLKSAVFYFEDYFSFFSLSKKHSTTTQFFVLPSIQKSPELSASPISHREANVRSDIVKYIKGEYLHFKSFENSDDVRRIVWKIYAKNKDLVVRTQELRNPYSSDVPLYVSFYNAENLLLQTQQFSQTMLSYYKNIIWSVFSNLKENKDIKLKLRIDQDINVSPVGELPAEMFEISAANWQDTLPVNDFYSVSNTSVLCFSSFATIDDIKHLLDRSHKSCVIIFVKISKVLRKQTGRTILKNIFLKPREGSIDDLRFKFFFSPLRKQIKRKESALLELLAKGENTFYEI